MESCCLSSLQTSSVILNWFLGALYVAVILSVILNWFLRALYVAAILSVTLNWFLGALYVATILNSAQAHGVAIDTFWDHMCIAS